LIKLRHGEGIAAPNMERMLVGALCLIVGVASAACGSSGGGSAGASGSKTLTYAIFMPFSGPDAAYGTVGDAGVIPAILQINKAGGVLGHMFTWKNVDTRGDPADAVPAAEQLIASTPSLVAINGPTSDEASATVPIFNRAGIPMFTGTGQSQFNRNMDEYFWRNQPPDDADGAAIAYYAYTIKHYKTAALVFGNDIASQGAEPSARAVFAGLGGRIVASETLALDQTSYETEVARVAAAKPDVIFTEADPQTSATFFRELEDAGSLVPIIGTDGTAGVQWASSVSHAIGAANFKKDYSIVAFGAPPSAGANVYNAAAEAARKYIPDVSQWFNEPYALAIWDTTIVTALAMLEAKSVVPKVFNSYIPKVSSPSQGATVVDTFAAGKAALAAGKRIQFIGGLGLTVYNKYHNSAGTFLAQASNGTSILSVIPGPYVSVLLAKYLP
jgi:ABC-type branched-subunit amino acid transport system substrate-binding protein